LNPAARWQDAVDRGARGDYAEAAAALGLLGDGETRWASLALSTLASHHRQVGDPGRAADLDARALQCATDDESRADALIGLAADAIANHQPEQAASWHQQAATHALDSWRTRTRWHWVGAERALLVGDLPGASEHGREAWAACEGRSVRHVAKSRIVFAAASGEVEALPEVSTVLSGHGWVTLEWPLALVAADHLERLPAGWLVEAWARGRAATYSIEGCLPEDRQQAWRAHPGVRRLREGGSLPGDG
jgi:hypothetical protein